MFVIMVTLCQSQRFLVFAALLLSAGFARASLSFDSPRESTGGEWSAEHVGLELQMPDAAGDIETPAGADVSPGAVGEPDPQDLLTSSLGAPAAYVPGGDSDSEEDDGATPRRTMTVVYLGSAVLAGFLLAASILSGTAILRMHREVRE